MISQAVDTEGVNLAIEKGEGFKIFPDYRNVSVLSAFKPIKISDDLTWYLMAEIDQDEAVQSVYELRNIMLMISGVCLVFICLFAYFFSSQVARGVRLITNKLNYESDLVSKVSDDIATSSLSLSDATTEQASSLQEAVASIDEISAMINKNTEASESSKEFSENSEKVAVKGKESVDNMIQAITEISDSNSEIMDAMNQSNKEMAEIVNVIAEIGEKTKVINDIVFQTKLLSFNASVEAARAGEHGKGFSVVAEEVGNLAQMSGKCGSRNLFYAR